MLRNSLIRQQIVPEPPGTIRSIKHNLPPSILPNKDKCNVQSTKAIQVNLKIPNKIQLSVGTQTTKVNILNYDVFIRLEKQIKETQIDLTEEENESIETFQPNSKLPQNVNNLVIDEKCMESIMNKSDEYKQIMSSITAILQNIINTVTAKSNPDEEILVKLRKQEKIIKLIDCLVAVTCNDKKSDEKTAEVINQFKSTQKMTKVQNKELEQHKKQITQKLVHHERTEAHLPNEQTNYFQFPTHSNSNYVNDTNFNCPRVRS